MNINILFLLIFYVTYKIVGKFVVLFWMTNSRILHSELKIDAMTHCQVFLFKTEICSCITNYMITIISLNPEKKSLQPLDCLSSLINFIHTFCAPQSWIDVFAMAKREKHFWFCCIKNEMTVPCDHQWWHTYILGQSNNIVNCKTC